MKNTSFHNSVGSIYRDFVIIEKATIPIDNLCSIQYFFVKNQKINFYFLVISLILLIASLLLHLIIIALFSFALAIVSQVINIKNHFVIVGINLKHKQILKAVTNPRKEDIELFIEKFNQIKMQ